MSSSVDYPLVVDLDGTLTPTDTLVESVLKVVRQRPLSVLSFPHWLWSGKAAFKEAIASKTSLAVELLPYRSCLLRYLQEEKARGRRLVLATAAHQSIADKVAEHLGIFDEVLATQAGNNLKGNIKLKAIQERVGNSFVYAGDSKADMPIWLASQAAVLVGVSKRTAYSVRRSVPVEQEFVAESPGLSSWLRSLRVHQWVKNLLLFVPLLTAFAFTDIENIIKVGLAFLAFSLTASGTYIVNDLLDIENDRAHPRKRTRPYASARIPIVQGLVVAFVSLLIAFTLAITVSKSFAVSLLLYFLLTSAYSWALKTYVLIDVLMLAILYTIRILAGSVAIGIATSPWLLAFSIFIFLSLALVKRCAELVLLEGTGKTASSGRDYRVTDLDVLWPLGVGSALSAVVVFGLFINAPETQTRYETPNLLWGVAIALTYWLARLWIKTSRGEMHDDPVVYALKDFGSRFTIVLMLCVVLTAHFFKISLLL